MAPQSSIARLQQAVVLAQAAAAAGWFAYHWPQSPGWAVGGALAIAFLHAWFLAVEFLLLRWASRDDPAPRAGWLQLAGAWLRESIYAVRVFGWRQPFRWRAIEDQLEAAAPAPRPIVFVHGFVCNRGFWNPWMREARRRGHPYEAVNLEPVFCSIDDYVATLDDAVRRVAERTGQAPALVCHSMGGLVARAWLRTCDGGSRVAHVVTIGTPHGGTWLARFGRRANARQMRIGCDWLSALSLGAALPAGRFTCWYSNCDNIVFPPSTATLAGADNRFLPGAAHVDLAFRPRLIQDTFSLLGAL